MAGCFLGEQAKLISSWWHHMLTSSIFQNLHFYPKSENFDIFAPACDRPQWVTWWPSFPYFHVLLPLTLTRCAWFSRVVLKPIWAISPILTYFTVFSHTASYNTAKSTRWPLLVKIWLSWSNLTFSVKLWLFPKLRPFSSFSTWKSVF